MNALSLIHQIIKKDTTCATQSLADGIAKVRDMHDRGDIMAAAKQVFADIQAANPDISIPRPSIAKQFRDAAHRDFANYLLRLSLVGATVVLVLKTTGVPIITALDEEWFSAKTVDQQMLAVKSGQAHVECNEHALGGTRQGYTRLIAPALDNPPVAGSQPLRELLKSKNGNPPVCRITFKP